MNSWKTTSAGVSGIVSGITGLAYAYNAGHLTPEVISASVSAILVGVGLVFARDNDKSSEQVGAK